jgi:hypothetical protein
VRHRLQPGRLSIAAFLSLTAFPAAVSSLLLLLLLPLLLLPPPLLLLLLLRSEVELLWIQRGESAVAMVLP